MVIYGLKETVDNMVFLQKTQRVDEKHVKKPRREMDEKGKDLQS